MPAPSLSISIVCCNNADTIGRTLDSIAALADEIVAVDSGSTDATIELLERAGARIIHQPWLGYVRQKQFALEQCRSEWILHLDSDESLLPELRASIQHTLQSHTHTHTNASDDPSGSGEAGGGGGGEHTAYALNRKVFYAGKLLNHAWQPEWRTRLAKRSAVRWAGEDPHDRLEPIDPAATIGRLTGDLRHDSILSIAAFLERQARHGRIAAASAHARGKRSSPLRLATAPAGAWCKQLILRSAWRDGWRGWVAASATAAASLCKHAALLELTHNSTSSSSDADPPPAQDPQ
ncbi:MAG: glycosyltransferase family 2 protein [Phycisphaerales bacterium]